MFDKLKRFLQREPPPIAERIEDPVLGTLVWSKDDQAWISNRTEAGFDFQISGTPMPDKVLLNHAADLLEKQQQFVAEVLAHVKSESVSKRRPQSYHDEISDLRVERVCLFWPDRPDDGMIELSGGRDYRLWRCDYIARKPKGLGFDS
jgi:hypothetical protein